MTFLRTFGFQGKRVSHGWRSAISQITKQKKTKSINHIRRSTNEANHLMG